LKKNEFGDLAVMITEFFSQKNQLVKEISVRKQAEMILQREKDLSETIINSQPGIFFLFDAQAKFLRWNKNFEIVSGYSQEEMIDRHASDFFEGEESALVRQRIQDVFSNGHAHIEAHFVAKNGVSTPYLITGVRIEINELLHVLGTGIDISERKRAEELINRQLEELKRWQDVMLDREDRIQELKREVNELSRRLGEEVSYPSQEAGSADLQEAKP
jgi:PAS domain S-box-containing protein